jgi:hypothetical protein
MSLPIPTNTTCDVYRSGNNPPAAPDVAAVPCRLEGSYARRMGRGEGMVAGYRFTHVMLVDPAADIRDALADYNVGANADTVYVPDRNGTPFRVVFVEVRQRGHAAAVRKVYLDRGTPHWPTNEL